MSDQYCAIVPEHIKNAYGEVLGQKIMRFFPNRIPTVEEAMPLAEQLTSTQKAINLAPYANFVSQQDHVAELLKRSEELAEEKFEDPIKGELHVLKNGQVLPFRASQIPNEIMRGKKSRQAQKNLQANPNNQMFAEFGTEMHALAENLLVHFTRNSDLVDLKTKIENPVIDKPSYLSNQAYDEVVSTIKFLADKVIAKQQSINDRTGTQGKVVILPELFMHDKKTIGGTVDAYMMYSNGRIDKIDYKFMKQQKEVSINEFGEKTYIPSTEISDLKRRSFRLQTSTYRDIEMNSYGIRREQFDENYIIPFMVDYAIDPVYNEDGTLRSQNKPGEFKAPKYLKEVKSIIGVGSGKAKLLPTGYQATNNALLDEILVGLNKKLETAIENARKSYYSESDLKYNEYSDEITKLERLIEDIVMNKNVNSVVDYILNMTNYITANGSNLSLADVTYYLSEIDYFKELLETVTKNISVDEQIQNIQDIFDDNEALRNSITTNSYKTGLSLQLLNQAYVILRDRLENDLEQLNPDIAEIHRSNLGDKLIPWSEIEEPVLQTAYKIFNEADNKKHVAVQKLLTDIEDAVTKLKDAGYTQQQANELIFSEKTGNVISRFSGEKRNDYFKALEENNIDYIKSIYEITPENRQKYLDDLEKRKSRLAAIYSKNSKAYDSALDKFEQENDLINSDNAWLNRIAINKYATLKNEEDNYSEEYKNLPPAVKEYADFYYQTMRGFDKILPNEYIRENFLANLPAQSASLLRQLLQVRSSKDIFNLFKRNLIDGFKIRQADVATLTLDINSPDMRVPLAYKDGFEFYDKELNDYRASYTREENNFMKNKDLMYNLAMFGQAVYHKAFMDETLETFQALSIYAKDKKTYKRDLMGNIRGTLKGYRIPELEVTGEIQKDLIQLIRTHVLQENITSQDKISKGGYSLNKFASALFNQGRRLFLGFNWKAALAGTLTGQVNTFAYSRKNRQFNRKQLMNSFRHFNSRNSRMLHEYFAIENENHTQRLARKISGNILNRVINRDTKYIFYRPEEKTSNIILGAMIQNYGIDPKTGLVKRLSQIEEEVPTIEDMWLEATKSGKTIENLPLTDEQFAQFRTMVRSTSRRIKGTNVSTDQSVYSGHILSKALGMFRVWILPTYLNVYGGARYNKAMDDFEIGAGLVAMKELGALFKDLHRKGILGMLQIATNSIPIFGNRLSEISGLGYKVSEKASLESYEAFIKLNPMYENRITKEEWNQLRQDNMNQNLSYMRQLGMLALVLALLNGDFDDDGKRDSKQIGILNFAHAILTRLQLELFFFYNVSSTQEILQSPLPVMGLLRFYGNLIGNTVDTGMDYVFGQNELSKTGKDIDRTPPFHYTTRAFSPAVYQYNSLMETLNLKEDEYEAKRKQGGW